MQLQPIRLKLRYITTNFCNFPLICYTRTVEETFLSFKKSFWAALSSLLAVIASLDTRVEGTTAGHAAALSPYNSGSFSNFTLIFQEHIFETLNY